MLSRRPRPSAAAQDRHRRPQRQPKAATGPIYRNRARTVASHGPHPLFQPQGRSASVDSGLGNRSRQDRRGVTNQTVAVADCRDGDGGDGGGSNSPSRRRSARICYRLSWYLVSRSRRSLPARPAEGQPMSLWPATLSASVGPHLDLRRPAASFEERRR